MLLYTFLPNLLNVLVQIAYKMELEKGYIKGKYFNLLLHKLLRGNQL
jgi:hypothetical protein